MHLKRRVLGLAIFIGLAGGRQKKHEITVATTPPRAIEPKHVRFFPGLRKALKNPPIAPAAMRADTKSTK